MREKLSRIEVLARGGDLERDLALQFLREIYEEIKFGVGGVSEQSEAGGGFSELRSNSHLGSQGGAAVEMDEREETRAEEPCLEPAPEAIPEPVVYMEPEDEPDPEFDPAPTAPQPEEQPVPAPGGGVTSHPTADVGLTSRQRIDPEIIRNLYGAPRRQPEAGDGRNEPHANFSPSQPDGFGLTASAKPGNGTGLNSAPNLAINPGPRLGEAPLHHPTLRRSIGLNDRFLMIRDLFAGDTAAFDRTIDRLEGFGSLDEAVIWLHDNFSLNADSEGVRLLMSLLERKYSL